MAVTITGNADPREAQAYVDYLQEKYNRKLETLDINIDGDFADLDYTFSHVHSVGSEQGEEMEQLS